MTCNFFQEMKSNFQFWMAFYGKMYSEFDLVQGDFFEPKYRNAIVSSTCIFVNNLEFCAENNLKLKDMLVELEDGAQIVSTRSFCSARFRINRRTRDGKNNKVGI